MSTLRQVHVVGAGLAGLAASLQLAKAGIRVTLHESATQAGGRCRSYFDETLGCRIDNGNHLVMAGNAAVMAYLGEINTIATLTGPPDTEFHFLDLVSGERWTVRPNRGRIPWWIFVRKRRVPGTRAWDYVRALRLGWAGPDDCITAILRQDSPLFQRFWLPLGVSALNTDLGEASPIPLIQVLRETFVRGGAACRPLVPREGLSETLIDPAVARLHEMGGELRLGSRLRAIQTSGERVLKLSFDDSEEPLDADAALVLAVPASNAARLVPDLVTPDEFRPIVNAHFRVSASTNSPHLIGVIGGAVQWVFRKRDILSVTISAGEAYVDMPATELAELLWPEVQRAYNLKDMPLPPWQIVKERRATFAATATQLARRPKPYTRWNNLALAGDWTDTGLPATIEGAIRSGFAAANLLLGATGKSKENAWPKRSEESKHVAVKAA
jgi:hydroxysqualene dehydroxylase